MDQGQIRKRKLIRTSFNLQPQANLQQVQANKAAAILVRQAKMNAMPFQRATLNDRGYVDLANANYAADTTGTVTLLATIAQGTSVNQRVGKRVHYASIQIRGRAVAGASGVYNDVAFIIVYDKRPTGSLPTITDVLSTSNSNSMNNDDNSGRFQIVRRVDHLLLGNGTACVSGREGQNMDDFIKFRRPVVYKIGAAGTIGDIEEGALYGISIGSSAAGATAALFTLSFRVRFTEN